jgi:hypothetical protein
MAIELIDRSSTRRFRSRDLPANWLCRCRRPSGKLTLSARTHVPEEDAGDQRHDHHPGSTEREPSLWRVGSRMIVGTTQTNRSGVGDLPRLVRQCLAQVVFQSTDH